MEPLLDQVAAYVRSRGFAEVITDPGHLPGSCPLAMQTEGALAYFRATETDRLEHDWRQSQTEIACLPADRLPLRRLYLTLLVTDTQQQHPVWQNILRDLHVCRKLVVAAARPEVGEWLEELPFLPIPEESAHSRAIVTPAHALFSAGFRTDLAARLLGRADLDQLAKQFFSGRVLSDPGDPAPQELQLTARAGYRRLHAMEIENFRPFARNLVLPLDADLTLIYGPNGTGKSSLAQALEWSVIGEVGTLEQASDDTRTGADLPPYINVTSPDRPARVRLLLRDEQDGAERTLERRIDRQGTRSLLWEGQRVNSMSEALTRVLDADLPLTPHFSTLKAMARQSHFLDQETIRDFLSTRAQDRYKALANMVGTVDFERAGEKLGHVVIALRKEQEQAVRSEQELELRLEAERRTLGELQGELAALGDSNGVGLDLAGVARELADAGVELGLPLGGGVPEDAPGMERFAASLTDGLQATRATWQERLARLAGLVEQEQQALAGEASAAGLRESVAFLNRDLAGIQMEVEQAELRFGSAEAACGAAEGARAEAERQAREAAARLDAVQALAEAGHAWMRARQVEADAAARAEAASELARTSSQAVAQVEAEVRGLMAHQERLRGRLTAVAELRARLPAAEAAGAAQRQAAGALAELARRREQLQGQRRALQRRVAESEGTVAELAAGVTRLEQRCAERQRLLGALSRYLDGARCPLCGHDWEEADLLYRQVQGALQDSPAELLEAQQHLARSSQQLGLLLAEREQLEQRLGALEAEARDWEQRGAAVRAVLTAWLDLAGTLGERPEQPSGAAVQRWEAACRADDRAAQLAAEEARLAECRAAAGRAEADLAAAGQALQGAAAARSLAEPRYRRAEQAAPAGVARPVPEPEQVRAAEEDRAATARAAGAAAEALRAAREELSAAEAALGARRGARAALRSRLDAAQLTLRAAEQAAGAYRAALAALGLADAPGAAAAELAALRERLARLDRAEERARWLARAARVRLLGDAAAGARQRTTQLEADLDEARHFTGRWTRAIDLGARAATALDGARVDEQNQRLTYYEPTINEIYRRINPHPYFSVIRLQPAVESGELTMHATTPDGQARLPVQRYFSMAQANVVALSIFLGTALLQTWSGLRLICIDDPIQQMDDLNTVAFLDVLHGVIQRGRQVVITTANKEFYQLMLRRYAYLNEQRTRFRALRLRSVNLTEGPEIAEDSPCFLPGGVVRLGAPMAGAARPQ